MKIQNIKITNYRSINEVNFEFNSLLNVFVGVNGSGKTTILDAIIISLSWLINRIQREEIIFEEPRYLFHVIIDLLHSIEIKFQKEHHIKIILHDIEYLLHKMSSLSDLRKDNLIAPERFPNHIIERIFEQLEILFYKTDLKNDTNRQDVATRNEGRELQIVTKTIENFIEGYSKGQN